MINNNDIYLRNRYVAATDTSGRSTRAPELKDKVKSPKYFGTAIADPVTSGQTELPVMHWFIQNATAAKGYVGIFLLNLIDSMVCWYIIPLKT
jgi:hypothetical protein